MIVIYLLFFLTTNYLLLPFITFQDFPSLNNLDERCFRCICLAASDCNETALCYDGYCGPFKISRIYWSDAGKVTLPEDTSNRPEAFESCVFNYTCATQAMTNYFVRFGKDCNNDGITDCDDYSMMHFNGGPRCFRQMNRNLNGRLYLGRYKLCYPETKLRFTNKNIETNESISIL